MSDEELQSTCLHFVKKYAIPSHLIRSLLLYARERRPVGRFLQSVIANDLMGAMSRADPQSRQALHGLTMFVFNEMPGQSHGTESRYDMWLREEKEWKVESFEKWRHEEEGPYVDRRLTYCVMQNREKAFEIWTESEGTITLSELVDRLNDDMLEDLAILEAACEVLIEEFS